MRVSRAGPEPAKEGIKRKLETSPILSFILGCVTTPYATRLYLVCIA